jgi:RNA polymerase sigma-70 factor (ECF subfamily)
LKSPLFCEETTREFRESPAEKAFPCENTPPSARPRPVRALDGAVRGGGSDVRERPRRPPPINGPEIAVRQQREPWTSDGELVAHILAGSPEHFEMLYESYFPRVYRFALKRLGDPAEAEDVTQEVFFTVFNALESFEGRSTLLVWIFGITRNTVNRRFRKARPHTESLDADGASAACDRTPAVDRVVDARRALDRCEAVIEKNLTPLQRRIFHLKHLRRQPIRSIAVALGKSENAVKANLYRMRRAIAEAVPGLDSLFRI